MTPLGRFQSCPELCSLLCYGKIAPDAIMKAIFYAQLNPSKTMSQLINDRALYRLLIVGVLFYAWCI